MFRELFGSDTWDTCGPVHALRSPGHHGCVPWLLCKLQGFEVAIHSCPVKKLVYVGLYGTQLAAPGGRILYARNRLTVYKSRACLLFLKPDQETRVGEMLRKACLSFDQTDGSCN
jgi:hypothetical protein